MVSIPEYSYAVSEKFPYPCRGFWVHLNAESDSRVGRFVSC